MRKCPQGRQRTSGTDDFVKLIEEWEATAIDEQEAA
jgi:hypothetical protein